MLNEVGAAVEHSNDARLVSEVRIDPIESLMANVQALQAWGLLYHCFQGSYTAWQEARTVDELQRTVLETDQTPEVIIRPLMAITSQK